MDKLQQDINLIKTGTLLSIKLLNKDELIILIDDVNAIIEKFYNMIKKSCENTNIYSLIKTDDPTLVHIILSQESESTESLAYSIYSQIQLYVDSEFPESYLKCAMGSIKFYPEQSISAKKLASILSYGMKNSKEQTYYCHEDHPVDIELIRKSNINLNSLRLSLLNKKAKFMYQPIIDSISGKVEYHECLLRIADKEDNLLSVGPMIKDAEKKGLINIIDTTVIKMAIEELHNDKDAILSVNISNIGVIDTKFLKKIERFLKKYPVADRLIIEITETSLNQDFLTTKKFIEVLQNYGCRFALDDFGSGFTSFKQLLNLPIDIIKIDGSYIKNILNEKHNKAFVESLIKLASNLKVRTVAEYVENSEVAKFLTDIKVDSMQGNFFLPASEKRN